MKQLVRKVTSMIAVGIILLSVSCGPTPPGPRPPTLTPAPPPQLELVEVRAGAGDGAPVSRDERADEYNLLPQASIKVVVKQVPVTFGRTVSINGVPIQQVAQDQMHGDDARFTVIPEWRSGGEDQEMIIIQPQVNDRTGSGFLIRIQTTSGSLTSPALAVTVGPPAKLPNCAGFFPVGNPPPPSPLIFSSNAIAQTLLNVKLNDPAKKAFVVALQIDDHNAVRMELQDTPSLRSDQALVHIETTAGRRKFLRALNGSTCAYTGKLYAVAGQGRVGELLITSADTTSLVLGREVCDSLACLSVQDEDSGVWTEPSFWKLFGGRWVDFTWLEN